MARRKGFTAESAEEEAQRARRRIILRELLFRQLMKTKRVLVFAGKLGYQTRSFDAAARKLGVELAFVTDRCHQLEDPWGDRAIAAHFESPEVAAYTVLEEVRGNNQGLDGGRVDGILALGDRPAVAAAYVSRGLGVTYK